MTLQNEESTVYRSEFINAYDKTKIKTMHNSLSGRSSRNLNILHELEESSTEIERFENNVRTLEDIFKEKNEAKRRDENLAKRSETQNCSVMVKQHLQEKQIKK
jgi:UDP-N-acetyl-D-mannosaminuronate dehydrogenase